MPLLWAHSLVITSCQLTVIRKKGDLPQELRLDFSPTCPPRCVQCQKHTVIGGCPVGKTNSSEGPPHKPLQKPLGIYFMKRDPGISSRDSDLFVLLPLWLLEARNCTTPGSFYCRVDQVFLSITISFNPCSKLVM